MSTAPQWQATDCYSIIDQLRDIAKDENDPLASGITWVEDVDKVPYEALAELESSGWFTVSRGQRKGEYSIAFNAAGAAFYDPCDNGGH